MANHTPGPWEIEDSCNEILIKSINRFICKVYVHWINYNANIKPSLEEIGNARLIAAAPEMLDMLIELQESAQYWSEYGAPFDIVTRLNAIISKAKGEA